MHEGEKLELADLSPYLRGKKGETVKKKKRKTGRKKQAQFKKVENRVLKSLPRAQSLIRFSFYTSPLFLSLPSLSLSSSSAFLSFPPPSFTSPFFCSVFFLFPLFSLLLPFLRLSDHIPVGDTLVPPRLNNKTIQANEKEEKRLKKKKTGHQLAAQRHKKHQKGLSGDQKADKTRLDTSKRCSALGKKANPGMIRPGVV